MAMRRSFGTAIGDTPKGMLCRVTFPVLCFMDKDTGDGRILASEGGGVVALPRPIFGQFVDADGHAMAVPVGRLDEVTFETDDEGKGIPVSGSGWLLNDEHGRRAAFLAATKAMPGNSVDLRDIADVELIFDDPEDWRPTGVKFGKWNIGKTTLVGMPAFADAAAEVDEAVLDELMASFGDDGLVCEFSTITLNLDRDIPELTADGAPKPAWADFHIAEADGPQKIVVEGDGRVYGHLALWNSCHEGIEGQCTTVPRGDNYASFNAPGVLTDHGMVETGPIFLLGGHPKKGKVGKVSVDEAYGGVENAWADVRVTAGVHGPWLSGRVRPGISEEAIAVARASRISGHWKNGRLIAVVSVNVPGFTVPGSGTLAYLRAGMGFRVEDGEVTEMVASFPPCSDEDFAPAGGAMELTITPNATTFTKITFETLRKMFEEGSLSEDVVEVVVDEAAPDSKVVAALLATIVDDDDIDELAELS